MKLDRLFVLAPVLAVACGSSQLEYRTVDTPVGQTVQYGAPKNTTYTTRAEAERGYLRVIVREQSECDKIEVQVVRRVIELVEDGEDVKHRSPPQNVQIAEGTRGTVPCHERFARRVRVALQIGDQTYRLGMPDKRGELWVNLSERIGQDLYGKDLPPEATVTVEGVPAGTVSLAGIQAHEARVRELLAELEKLLEKKQTEQSSAEIARAYSIYEQLVELAPLDARLRGLESRLLELVYERKSLEASQQLERDIQVLGKAKGLLGAAAGVPPYVRDAVLGGNIMGPALSWAGITGALSLSRYPSLCGGRSAQFEWSNLDAGTFPASTVVALSYLRYAYGNDYSGVLGRICRRFR